MCRVYNAASMLLVLHQIIQSTRKVNETLFPGKQKPSGGLFFFLNKRPLWAGK